MQTIRAKVQVTNINLQSGSGVRADIAYDTDKRNYFYKDTGEPLAKGEVPYETFDQPTVTLNVVTGGSPENESFFAASPAGTITLTISNPRAAEFFSLRDEFYVDFTRADG